MADAGRRILVTGASTGIGRAVTDYLAQRGDRVYAGAREDHDLEALEEVPGVIPLRLDVAQPKDIAASVSKVKEETERLDGLVNNAGVSGGGPLMEISAEEIERQFAVNVFGVHRVTKAFFPLILRAKGRIVNMSSVGGRLALPFLGPYVMTKFAIEAYSDSLRRELAPHGVHVAVIQPGNVRTPIWNKTDPEDPRYDGSIFEERGTSSTKEIRRGCRRRGSRELSITHCIRGDLGSAILLPRATSDNDFSRSSQRDCLTGS